MLSAAFIFESGDLDDEFWRLDGLIEQAAADNAGFIGKDVWVSEDGRRRNSTYYWKDKQALGEFARHPLHLEAKAQYERWYMGFHVVISEVTKTYGDGGIQHVTPDARARSRARKRAKQ
ncbi:MAG: DUF4188 domain-containing protein [Pseudomonadota bacterium]